MNEEDICFFDDGIGCMQYLGKVKLCAGEGRSFRSRRTLFFLFYVVFFVVFITTFTTRDVIF